MNNPMASLAMITFIIGLTSIASKRKHLLSTLLALELVALATLMLMNLHLLKSSNDTSILMTFLTISACEGTMGLSILVSLIRSYGNDVFKSFNML
uniref:NADH dehydrogenase subunit 4L n=1 Tax=Haplodiplatys aotouensis TaxID=2962943 RepID=UPI00211489B9|nr:NADH dehydrogenase subunit 4L [Haplodiplatys aotouensis]UTI38886.1 NADH dehydrogenase subunit 4L [Haplodiplatys aotouensis]UTI38899.1 NADH dehydrogenase subunit 4L [Haplodiplatys aotouensis]